MLKKPESMNEVVYFTRRAVDDGKIMAWAFKDMCPECGKGLMGKPVEKGKVKIRAKEYVCPECNHTVEKNEYEETLTLSVEYTCPKCRFEGEAEIPFKRKSFQGVKSFVFECEKCSEKIPITKKMKGIKEK
ncbi:hypothetical protein HQ529_06180 [Candidatus Woesearchaeota archaeon]|nr:hypothetical protein [Candidatus Woesearchaeota archaeon]